MTTLPTTFSRRTRADSKDVDELDDDFIRQNEETPKVINFIQKFEHLKNITNTEEN